MKVLPMTRAVTMAACHTQPRAVRSARERTLTPHTTNRVRARGAGDGRSAWWQVIPSAILPILLLLARSGHANSVPRALGLLVRRSRKQFMTADRWSDPERVEHEHREDAVLLELRASCSEFVTVHAERFARWLECVQEAARP